MSRVFSSDRIAITYQCSVTVRSLLSLSGRCSGRRGSVRLRDLGVVPREMEREREREQERERDTSEMTQSLMEPTRTASASASASPLCRVPSAPGGLRSVQWFLPRSRDLEPATDSTSLFSCVCVYRRGLLAGAPESSHGESPGGVRSPHRAPESPRLLRRPTALSKPASLYVSSPRNTAPSFTINST